MESAIGTIHYSKPANYGYKVIGSVSSDFLEYYYTLIPDYLDKYKPKYKAHVSVVRREIPLNLDEWGKFENQQFRFYYEPIIHFSNPYYYIQVVSSELDEVRESLGLGPRWKHEYPPYPYKQYFHITVANTKGPAHVH